MSAEQNKILCAILTAILILLLSSFISELLYHPKSKGNKGKGEHGATQAQEAACCGTGSRGR